MIGPGEFARDELAMRTFPLRQILKLRLSNGTEYEGEIVRIEPRQHVVLYVKAERLRFDWEDIVSYSPVVAADPSWAEKQKLPTNQIRAFVVGDNDVRLTTKHYDANGEETDDYVPTDCRPGRSCMLSRERSYRAEGVGMKPSGDFRIDEESAERVTIRLRAGNSSGWVSGVILGPLGAAMIVAGGLVAVLGDLDKNVASVKGGGVLIGVGIVSIAACIGLVVTGKIGVRIESRPELAMRRPARGSGGIYLTAGGLAF